MPEKTTKVYSRNICFKYVPVEWGTSGVGVGRLALFCL